MMNIEKHFTLQNYYKNCTYANILAFFLFNRIFPSFLDCLSLAMLA